MSRARDMANLGAQAGSGFDASDLTTGTLGNTVQDNITRLGTVTTGTMKNTIHSDSTFPSGTVLQVKQSTGTGIVNLTGGTGSHALNITNLSITSSGQASYFILSFSGVTLNWAAGYNVRKGFRIGTTSTGSEVEEFFTEYTHTDVRIKQPTFVEVTVTPSTSTAYTYYCSIFRDGSADFYLNDNGSDDGTYMFKCVEVAQ